MIFREGGTIPGLYFQANNDNPGGGESLVYTSMKSMVPEGAIIPKNTAPPETHVGQVDLDKAAEARSKLIEMFG